MFELRPVGVEKQPKPHVFPCRPSSLDAYVFGHLAPILKSKLPNGKLQQHLKSLDNLTNFCTNILLLYFPRDGRGETFFICERSTQRWLHFYTKVCVWTSAFFYR